MRAKFNYPQDWTTLPDYTAHAGQTVTVLDQLSADEADRGEDLERMFHITADDEWKGHAFESELDPQPTLALYIMEPIGVDGALEAVNVMHFCSDECRQVIAQNTEHTVNPGVSEDWIEGTVCDECGVPLTR